MTMLLMRLPTASSAYLRASQRGYCKIRIFRNDVYDGRHFQGFSCFSTARGGENSSSAPVANPTSSSSNHPNHDVVTEKSSKSYIKTISELSKARLSALVVSTTTFGYLAAAPVPINYTTLACASLGTALCSSSASTLNQIFEYDRDSKMKRTSRRPLVTQDVVGLRGASVLAATTGVTGGGILYLGTDAITAALGVGNIALYAGAYTYLKPRSEWNTWVGAVVGAIPPVMGYTAATNGMGLLDLESALVGSTLLLWQFPHFFALAWMHRVDYARLVQFPTKIRSLNIISISDEKCSSPSSIFE